MVFQKVFRVSIRSGVRLPTPAWVGVAETTTVTAVAFNPCKVSVVPVCAVVPPTLMLILIPPVGVGVGDRIAPTSVGVAVVAIRTRVGVGVAVVITRTTVDVGVAVVNNTVEVVGCSTICWVSTLVTLMTWVARARVPPPNINEITTKTSHREERILRELSNFSSQPHT